MADEVKDTLNITLHIYDTDIRVFNVKRDDEILYRRAQDLINERLNAYYQAFAGSKKEPKEIMYYAMIDIGYRLQHELRRNDTKPYDDVLKQLTTEIESELKEK